MSPGLNDMMSYRRKNKLSVVNMGLKIFTKNKGNQPSKVDFRILSEALDVMIPMMSKKRIFNVEKELFIDITKISDHMLTF